MIRTDIGVPVDEELFRNYFTSLVNRFFKILPMAEEHNETLPVYMRSLQLELLGCKDLLESTNYSSYIMSLLLILQYHIAYPDTDIKEVRRDVFNAIELCNKLKKQFEIG